jgi:hypothetical protein
MLCGDWEEVVCLVADIITNRISDYRHYWFEDVDRTEESVITKRVFTFVHEGKKGNVENYVQLLFNWVRTNHDVDHKLITEERETCAFVFVSSMSVCSFYLLAQYVIVVKPVRISAVKCHGHSDGSVQITEVQTLCSGCHITV